MIDTASGSSTASRSPAEPNLTDRQSRPQVGSVLRRARMHHRLSLREVERRIGRSNAYLSQVERGLIKQPNLIVLLELAELYGLNFETLASWARWVPAAPDPVGPHLRDSIVASKGSTRGKERVRRIIRVCHSRGGSFRSTRVPRRDLLHKHVSCVTSPPRAPPVRPVGCQCPRSGVGI